MVAFFPAYFNFTFVVYIWHGIFFLLENEFLFLLRWDGMHVFSLHCVGCLGCTTFIPVCVLC